MAVCLDELRSNKNARNGVRLDNNSNDGRTADFSRLSRHCAPQHNRKLFGRPDVQILAVPLRYLQQRRTRQASYVAKKVRRRGHSVIVTRPNSINPPASSFHAGSGSANARAALAMPTTGL